MRRHARGAALMAVALHRVLDGSPDAPPLLLGASLGTSLDMWAPQVSTLGARARLVRFDHRGHGGSPAPPGPYALDDLGGDVLALLDDLGLARVSYCGVSLGGMVGMWLAVNAPERIDRLVLVCTSAHMPPPSAWEERANAVLAAGTVDAIADAVVGRWLTPAFAREHPEALAGLRAQLSATPASGYAACCAAIGGMDLRPVIGKIAAPTLVIGGDQDPSTPTPEHGARIAEAIAGARLVVVPSAAHLANVEQAGAVSRLVADFLDLPEAP